MSRPTLYVLAGVNGAGKSSLGGCLLTRAGLAWYDPDAYARGIVRALGVTQMQANGMAWQEGVRRLQNALARGRSVAIETTLGGNTMVGRFVHASTTHDILVWYCGLASIEKHLERIHARVDAGGHDIPAEKVRERWRRSVENLIGLMPYLAHLRVYDNSRDAVGGRLAVEPALVLNVVQGEILYPCSAHEIARTPDWAKPIVEAAFER
ncbi:MAG TPA: AAA family ATPase [Castellaniella sp.]|uniref:AAA family ATPase n=1 Tax=Castellaniella sp. TaxID=1955812 RepID=UPI002EE69539